MLSLQYYIFRLYLRTFGQAAANPETPIPKLREAFEKETKIIPFPKKVQIQKINVSGCPAEWLIPENSNRQTVLLYLHGGGYAQGSANSHRALAGRLARAAGIPALLLEYRLAPEYPFPAALDDAVAAFNWLLDQGFSPKNIFFAGDSSGGGLVLSTAIKLRDSGRPLPAAIICLSPLADLTGSGETVKTKAKADPWLTPEVFLLYKHYYGSLNPALPLLSPIFADLKNLPPLLIYAGSDEILLSDATRLAERGRAAGVKVTLEVWPGLWHVWQGFAPYLPEANQAIAAIGAFIKEHLPSK